MGLGYGRHEKQHLGRMIKVKNIKFNPDKAYVASAVKEYLSRGGNITKIAPSGDYTRGIVVGGETFLGGTTDWGTI